MGKRYYIKRINKPRKVEKPVEEAELTKEKQKNKITSLKDETSKEDKVYKDLGD